MPEVHLDDTIAFPRGTREAVQSAKERGIIECYEPATLKPLGMVSMFDYMDRVLGHTPETARKRLRVARALANLPELSLEESSLPQAAPTSDRGDRFQ